MSQVERHFRPEFLNRVDEIIVFKQLTREDLQKIIVIETKGLSGRLREKNIILELSEPAKEYIIDEGYNPEFGARPLRRALQRILEEPLAEEVLRGSFTEGTIVRVEVDPDSGIFFTHVPVESPPPEPEPVEVAAEEGGAAEGETPAAPKEE